MLGKTAFLGKFTKPLAIISACFLAFAAPVTAAGLGSSATAIVGTDLYSGPGTHYPTSGAVSENQAVIVTRCSDLWCLLDDEGGWIAKQDLAFGHNISLLVDGPSEVNGRSAEGFVCFHDGENFTGAHFCLESGTVVTDLSLHGWDNRIASISVDEGTSANVCRDPKFSSFCVLVNEDKPYLPRLLSNSVSSFQIWEPIPDLLSE